MESHATNLAQNAIRMTYFEQQVLIPTGPCWFWKSRIILGDSALNNMTRARANKLKIVVPVSALQVGNHVEVWTLYTKIKNYNKACKSSGMISCNNAGIDYASRHTHNPTSHNTEVTLPRSAFRPENRAPGNLPVENSHLLSIKEITGMHPERKQNIQNTRG